MKAPIVRYRDPKVPWSTLTESDTAVINRALRNEADMAYRRRVPILLDYLELKDGEQVFDCGCGMGFYLMTMSKVRRLNLIGLDGDLNRLRQARNAHVPASILQGDILNLPFAEQSFDKVLMTEVLEHLTDDRRGIKEVFRLLRPGGVLALSVPHADYPFWWDPINRIWTSIGGKPIRKGPLVGIWTFHERLYSVAQLVQVVEEASFHIEVIEQITHFAFPFSHFLVYGIGKPALERNWLPMKMRGNLDRMNEQKESWNPLNPINLGVSIFRAVDRLNDDPSVIDKNTFVNILVKARKPR